MATTVRMSDSGQHWVVEVSGPTRAETARETLRQLELEVDRSGMGKPTGILFDMRRAENGLSNLDKYQLAYGPFADLGVLRGPRIAILVAEGDRNYDFTFTLTRNLGLRSQLFTDEQECLNWLQAEQALQAAN